MPHLTEGDFQEYVARRLSPDRLVALDAHLESCPECGERLATAGQRRSAPSLASLGTATRHPEYEALAGYLDGTLAEPEHTGVHRHLDRCDACRADLAEMRAVDGALSLPQGGLWKNHEPLHLRFGGWAFPVGAAAGLLVGLAVGMGLQQPRITSLESVRSQLQARQEALRAEVREARVESDRLRARLVRAPEPASPPTEDGAPPTRREVPTPVTADPPPRMAQVKALPAEVAQAIREGRLTFPASLAELISDPEITRGTEELSAHVRPISPAGTAIAERRPLLSWAPVAGASTYEVVLLEGETLTKSGALTEARWRPAEPLRSGATYTWQVSADLPDGTRITTSTAKPRFRVLDAAAAARVQAYQRRYQGDPLVLGVLLAREGLLDDADRELRRAAETSPRSKTTGKLLDQLHARRAVPQAGSRIGSDD